MFNRRLIVVCALFLIWFSTPLFANIGHINWWSIGGKYRDNPAIGWHIITFLIFVYGVFYSVRKPLSIYLKTRSDNIKNLILKAKKAKDDANFSIEKYEYRLKNLDNEMSLLRDNFLQIGKNEKKRLINEAEIVKKQIEIETISIINSEIANAKFTLKSYVAKLSILLAREELKMNQVKINNQLLNNKFLSDISKSKGI